jgi:hypothetical protein
MSIEERDRSHLRALLSRVQGPSEFWLLGRMLGWSIVLPAFKYLLPVPTLARVMWMKPRTDRRSSEREQRVVRLAHLTQRAHRRSRGYNCLERSLIAYRFLSREGAAPELVLGVASSDGGLAGHAWVTVDGEAVGESADVLIFTPLVVIGEGGRPQESVRPLTG